MEQIDFSKITLEETGIYNDKYTFANIFQEFKIHFVSDVFNDLTMGRIMLTCPLTTKKELIGFISLLKYKYLNLPITNIDILEKKYETNLTDLYLLGFSFRDIVAIKAILSNKKCEINPKTFINYKFIDILKAFLPYADERMRLMINLIFEAFDKKQEPSNFQDPEILKMLRKQLCDIKDMRELLDMLSINIQQQIEQISEAQNISSGRK